MNIKLKKKAKSCFNFYFFKPLTRKFTDACIDAIALEKKIGGMYKPKYRIYIYPNNFFSRSFYNDINMNTIRKYVA